VQIISAARRIADLEGWSNITVRRLSKEISYSQPVLYAHFGSREGILVSVAIEGFQELGLALEKARKLGFAFSQLLELFQGRSSKPEVLSELFWAGLHGIAELTRTKRFPRSRQKERVRALVELTSGR
jgi:AcrR family transcriptional regulator